MSNEIFGGGRRATALQLLDLVRDFVLMSGRPIAGAGDVMQKDCTDLIRRIALLTHLAEEIMNFHGGSGDNLEELNESGSSSSSSDCLSEAVGAIQAAKRLLYAALTFTRNDDASTASTDGGTKKLVYQFQYVTNRLENALSNLPYDQFCISNEVQEQVDLVRAQLRRAEKKYESMSELTNKKLHSQGSVKWKVNNDVVSMSSVDYEVPESRHRPQSRDSRVGFDSGELKTSDSCLDECSSVLHSDMEGVQATKSQDEVEKPDEIVIPENFLCPISFELMVDPVIVSTGQEHNVKLEEGLTTRKLKKYRSFEGGFRRTVPVKTLVRHLSFGSAQEKKVAVTEIRKLSKSSSEHRVEIAEAGAIPQLVNLLTSEDVLTQENAISCILNLSLHEQNKRLVMLSGAVSYISQVLKVGSLEARECAAATIYSLSLADENKAVIGASGMIPGLLEILEIGSTRGKKDAARALLNLCMYQGNKSRAVKAGIVRPLLKLLSDSDASMVDEALYIMSVLCVHPEGKAAMANANSLLVLTEVLKTGASRSKENAAAVLLVLCKGDSEKLSWLTRLGAAIPLMRLAENGTERARRKATSLLEELRR